MAKLTQEQLNFLKEQSISLEEVFDATGMNKKDYLDHMRANNLLIAYGVSPCRKGGHTLKTRYGHCVMCDTSKIAYVKRKRQQGYVYVAISLKEKLTKIGCTNNVFNRVKKLNDASYGDISDWQLFVYSHQQSMGEVEHNIQKEFTCHQVVRKFFKENKMVDASEIYDINPIDVLRKIEELGYKIDYLNTELMLKLTGK